jgi:hypothetical protein
MVTVRFFMAVFDKFLVTAIASSVKREILPESAKGGNDNAAGKQLDFRRHIGQYLLITMRPNLCQLHWRATLNQRIGSTKLFESRSCFSGRLALINLVVSVTLAIFVPAILANGSQPSSNAAQTSQSIPWNALGTKATTQYSGDGLRITAMPNAARLRCVFQKLEAEATAEGLWLISTASEPQHERFRLVATSIGRGLPLNYERKLSSTGAVQIVGSLVRFTRAELIEEYTVSADGLQQDFIVGERPPGRGPLRLELQLSDARAQSASDGIQLVLDDSGRKLNYNRLQVTDDSGRELAASIEVLSPARLAIFVEDGGALYPVRIDPTFSDANWTSMGGLPGANDQVEAIVVDDSGDVYIGGAFSIASKTTANNIAKWNGSSWSALGSGMNGQVYTLAISGNDLYAGGLFHDSRGQPGQSHCQMGRKLLDAAWFGDERSCDSARCLG